MHHCTGIRTNCMLHAVFIIHYYNRLHAAGEFYFICPAELYSSRVGFVCTLSSFSSFIIFFQLESKCVTCGSSKHFSFK